MTNKTNESTPPTTNGGTDNSSKIPRDRKGWDGKLRVRQKGPTENGQGSSDEEEEDEEVVPPEKIDADEGEQSLPPYPRHGGTL